MHDLVSQSLPQASVVENMDRSAFKASTTTTVRELPIDGIETVPTTKMISKTPREVRPREEPTPPQTRSQSPMPSTASRFHLIATRNSFNRMAALKSGKEVLLNGKSLEIADVVAIAKSSTKVRLDEDPEVVNIINASVEALTKHLGAGEMVYGVNTGFGGSADVRTNSLKLLQKGLVQHQNSAILAPHDIIGLSDLHGAASDVQSKAMPTAWVRGLMLTRLNSIIRGHSAVSLPIIKTILAFLEHEITPIIPKRGSISASGDLIPLSYLAGALQGNPDIYVQIKDKSIGCRIISSDKALRWINMPPVVLGAKEGLGLLNGTAASASVASLVLYQANNLVLLSQVLTAMGVEAMQGSAESFHPFIARARPHRGQIEVAANILDCLTGSRLAHSVEIVKNAEHEGLAQDRYAFRTASQWIGPQVEDILLATEQVSVELNSTTDNPLIDVDNDRIYHGGNFQAASVTSAMEKSRLALSMIAKLLFAQTTEIINPAMNRGLAPNLCADDPSVSFWGKGIDISMAAYYSEIAYLSNPVSTHVQSAEMHNQSVNSLALISGRQTQEVVEILNMMCASYLVMVCQALDLRVLQHRFLASARAKVAGLVETAVTQLAELGNDTEKITNAVWASLVKEWDATSTVDLAQRAQKGAEVAAAALFRELLSCPTTKCSVKQLSETVTTWTATVAQTIETMYAFERETMFEQHKSLTAGYLGHGSMMLYSFVRNDLDIPFHRGLIDDPTYILQNGAEASVPASKRKTIGSHISQVCHAIESGAIHQPLMAAMRTSLS